jgi:hypothetical protein
MTVLLRTTLLRPLEPDVARIYLYMFDQLKEIPDIEGPTFTFFHLLAPHNPYVFDKDGHVRNNIPLTLQGQEKTGGWLAKKEYIEQMQYINKRILEDIDAILARSSSPPIIILQSDHGSASSWHHGIKGDALQQFWYERTANLNAWYAPPEIQQRLSDTMLSVNTFRILFFALFGDVLPPLAPHINASWYGKPYDFVDVVDTVDHAFDAKGEAPLTQ